MRKIFALALICVLPVLQGCITVAVGGAHVDNTVVFVEPGGICRVATDDKIKVVAVDDQGKQIVAERNIAGMYVIPKSVYDQLSAEWEKTHPKPAAQPAVAPATKTTMVDVKEKVQELQAIAMDAGNIRDEAADIMAEKNLTKEEYFGDKLP